VFVFGVVDSNMLRVGGCMDFDKYMFVLDLDMIDIGMMELVELFGMIYFELVGMIYLDLLGMIYLGL
jgi:hypothetical protein